MSDSTLKELWQQVAEKKSCEAKQKELTAQRDTLADRLKKLEKSKLAEQADVDRLEGHSLAAFFYQVIGKMDEKLDKERQNRLSGVVRGEVWLPVVKTGRVQVSQLVADAHQFANLWRRQLAGNADKLLRVFQQFRLGITRRCQRALIIERFCR